MDEVNSSTQENLEEIERRIREQEVNIENATLIAAQKVKTNDGYDTKKIFKADDIYYYSSLSADQNAPEYWKLDETVVAELLSHTDLTLTDEGKKIFQVQENSIQDIQGATQSIPIDFSKSKMERLNETEKGSYLLSSTSDMIDKVFDRISLKAVFTESNKREKLPERGEVNNNDCILVVETGKDTAKLDIVDTSSDFQASVPLLDTEEKALVSLANNLEEQIALLNEAITITGEALGKEIAMEDKLHLDENAGILIDEGKINTVAFLNDNQYEDLVNRTSLLDEAQTTFNEILNDGDTTLALYVDFEPDGNVTATMAMSSDEYGWTDYPVPLSEEEKADLKNELGRIAERDGTTVEQLISEARDSSEKATSLEIEEPEL